MLFLQQQPDRAWAAEELVTELRSSRGVVDQSIETLLAGGFILRDDDNRTRYQPASPEIDRLAHATADVYRRKPGPVRRAILSGSSEKLQTLADGFKLRMDDQ